MPPRHLPALLLSTLLILPAAARSEWYAGRVSNEIAPGQARELVRDLYRRHLCREPWSDEEMEIHVHSLSEDWATPAEVEGGIAGSPEAAACRGGEQPAPEEADPAPGGFAGGGDLFGFPVDAGRGVGWIEIDLEVEPGGAIVPRVVSRREAILGDAFIEIWVDGAKTFTAVKNLTLDGELRFGPENTGNPSRCPAGRSCQVRVHVWSHTEPDHPERELVTTVQGR